MQNAIAYSQCGRIAFIRIQSRTHGEVWTITDSDALPRIEAAMKADGATSICVLRMGGRLYPAWSRNRELDGVQRVRYMHNVVAGHEPNGSGQSQTDHIDGDALNNTTTNLRIVSARTNQQNQSQQSAVPAGVTWYSRNRRWRCMVLPTGSRCKLPGSTACFRCPAAAHAFCQLLRAHLGVPQLVPTPTQAEWLESERVDPAETATRLAAERFAKFLNWRTR